MRPPKRSQWLLAASATLAVLGGGAIVRAQQADQGPPQGAEEQPPPADNALSSGVVIPAQPNAPANLDIEPESAAPASAAPPKPAAPLKRPRYAVAVMQVLDKVTAQTLRFEAPVGRPVRYKTLIFLVRACETTAGDEDFRDAAAHVEVQSQPLPIDGKAPAPKEVFKGWMYANSPGLDLFQHPVYDAWLIACKTEAPSA
jgi:hypothetical protein